jgi:hypothetical protein
MAHVSVLAGVDELEMHVVDDVGDEVGGCEGSCGDGDA